MFNEVVIGECENGSFQNLASHAASSSRRKERLVSLQHQLGKISRCVEAEIIYRGIGNEPIIAR